jgi:DNA-binding transcriptional ArsR family regulator
MKNPALPKASQFEQLMRDDYAGVYYHWVQLVCDHFSDCSRAFEGDLQKMLILSLIGQSHFSRLRARQTDAPGATSYDPTVEHGTTASRLSDITGVPRETVRRKLKSLSEMGWITRDASGVWSLVAEGGSTAVRLDLQKLEDRAMARVAHFTATMVKELGQREPATGGPAGSEGKG